MAILQAYIDDSASDLDDQMLFLAGYLNRADKWALFSDAWAEEMAASPKISYLKMAEANSLRGEFHDWKVEHRDEKLRGLSRVIRHFRPFSFQFSVSRKTYLSQVKPNAPRGFGKAHFAATFGVVATLSRYLAQQGVRIPVHFIFDAQEGVSTDITLLFDYMIKSLPKNARKIIGSTPIFANDKNVPPLQAADMLAWNLRKEYEIGMGMGSLPMANLLRSENGHLHSEIPEEMLASWAKSFAQMPMVNAMQTKDNWRKARDSALTAISNGFVPPYGSRKNNFMMWCRERRRRFYSND